MSRLTKVYKNGKVTIDAEQFPPITQEAIDREVFNSEPIRAAIERLAEYEDRDAKGCEYCTRRCINVSKNNKNMGRSVISARKGNE